VQRANRIGRALVILARYLYNNFVSPRSSIFFYLNGKKTELSGDECFLPLANFLRKNCALPGTKIVCAEGDCGACSVLVAYPERKASGPTQFKVVNSCIVPIFLLDGASVVSIEGLTAEDGALSEIQSQMLSCHGSQCGFCTPGFVVTLAALAEEKKSQGKKISRNDVKNFCTGNLCRCTGYEPIIEAGESIDLAKCASIEKKYLTKAIADDLKKISRNSFVISAGEKTCFAPTKIADVAKVLKAKNPRIVSAATDLGVLHNKEKIDLYQTMTLHHVPELFDLEENARELKVGARVDLESLRLKCKKSYPEFADFLNIFASVQIRNFATLVGNVANASPIGDTLPFLFVMEAQVEIMGPGKKRLLPITELYSGYRKMNLKSGEWISAIIIPKLKSYSLKLYKVSQRRDLDISSVSAAFLRDNKSDQLKVAFGGVGPTTLRLRKFEKHATPLFSQYKVERGISSEEIKKACAELRSEMTPISDARASKEFRLLVSENLFRKFALEETLR
jgi:xanthine dehydrogenase small subunit